MTGRYRVTHEAPYNRVAGRSQGELDDTAEKDACRAALVEAVNDYLGRAPERIFTLPARQSLCARRFHAAWPSAKIVGIDGHPQQVRLNQYRDGFLGLFNNYLDEYVAAARRFRADRSEGEGRATLYDFVPLGRAQALKRVPVKSFPFPRYELSYLDFTGHLEGKLLQAAVDFIDGETTAHAVIGVTYQEDVKAPSKGGPEAAARMLNQYCRSDLALRTAIEFHGNMVLLVLLK